MATLFTNIIRIIVNFSGNQSSVIIPFTILPSVYSSDSRKVNLKVLEGMDDGELHYP